MARTQLHNATPFHVSWIGLRVARSGAFCCVQLLVGSLLVQITQVLFSLLLADLSIFRF